MFWLKDASLLLLQCYSLLLIRRGVSQRDGRYPFVSVPDSSVAVDDKTTKVFSTRVDVIVKNQTIRPFQIDTLHTSARIYYGSRTGLAGFLSVDDFRILNSSPSLVTVVYNVTYNYTALRDSIDNDQVISEVIGNLAVIKRGLEAYSNFSLYYGISADIQSFQFLGDSFCAKLGCPQGTFTWCNETTIGTSSMCVSSCKINFCLNDGWCIHHDGNTAPVCSCPTSYDTWYVGTHCETIIRLWMFVVFILLVVFCLAAIAVLTCCLPVRLKQRKTSFSESPQHPKPISTVSKPDLQLQPKEDPSTTTQRNKKSVSAPVSVPRQIAPPLSRSISDQSQTLIASSETGFEPGYGTLLTHRFGSPSTTSNTLRRSDEDHGGRFTNPRHLKSGASKDAKPTHSSEVSETEQKPKRRRRYGSSEEEFDSDDELQAYATILIKRAGPKANTWWLKI